MNKTALLIINACLALITISCGGHSSKSDSENDSIATADSAKDAISVAPAMLPDTAYASIRAIRPVTKVYLENIDGNIGYTGNMYANTPGVFTFRGGAFRDADFHGTVKGTPTKIDVVWEFKTDQSRPTSGGTSWGGGSGWTGQPLYVEWPDSCVKRFRSAGVVTDHFQPREIIVGSLAGRVYFIDYETGKASRQSIDITNPIKGTISLDPTLNGNLYVGQGIPVSQPFGALVIDLFRHKVTHTYGMDSRAPRHWGAYDSSALRVGRFLIRPGENGMLYKFLVRPGELVLHSTMHYTTASNQLGMEASMSQYANYGFTADNEGNLVCTDLNTMRPVWHYAMGDDTDSSPVLMVENGHPYIYTGSEIDKQGEGIGKFVKIDALNGHEVWHSDFRGRLYNVDRKHFDGGFYGTSLPGRGDCADLIFANVVYNTKGMNGSFVAMERASGKVRYEVPLRCYAWSSPVGFLNEKNEQYIFAADCAGRVYLLRGNTGEIIYSAVVGHNFESSPVVVGNTLVVGSRGNTIFKMAIR